LTVYVSDADKGKILLQQFQYELYFEKDRLDKLLFDITVRQKSEEYSMNQLRATGFKQKKNKFKFVCRLVFPFKLDEPELKIDVYSSKFDKVYRDR
jgi:hypothetical protein